MKIRDKVISLFRGEGSYIDNATKFVNSGNFSSDTKYFIWVDLKKFKVNIFTGSKNNWGILHSYLCTIGKKSTPTPKGTYLIGIKGLYFGVEKGYKCWYYTQFKGNYLFHSILYNLDGCVRLEKVNAKWIYDNIPAGTKVNIS